MAKSFGLNPIRVLLTTRKIKNKTNKVEIVAFYFQEKMIYKNQNTFR